MFTLLSLGVHGIVIACLSVCLSVRLHISKTTRPDVLYMLPVALALSSSVGNAVRRVYI